jgi:hypothetical protein
MFQERPDSRSSRIVDRKNVRYGTPHLEEGEPP